MFNFLIFIQDYLGKASLNLNRFRHLKLQIAAGYMVFAVANLSFASGWHNKLPRGLRGLASSFENASKRGKCSIDPRFLAAIAWYESGGGTSKAARDSRKEVMGRMSSSGQVIGSGSHDSSIRSIAYEFCRSGGYYQGRRTIDEIAEVYSPACAPNDKKGTNKNWPVEVKKYYSQLGGSASEVLRGNGDNKKPAKNYCELQAKKKAAAGQARTGTPRGGAPRASISRNRAVRVSASDTPLRYRYREAPPSAWVSGFFQ